MNRLPGAIRGKCQAITPRQHVFKHKLAVCKKFAGLYRASHLICRPRMHSIGRRQPGLRRNSTVHAKQLTAPHPDP